MQETYEEFIENILNTRGRFACGEEYHERHHILPKCLGGTNDEENLIDLYAREHFIAHKLLALENPDNKSLNYAWTMMSWIKSDCQQRYNISSKEYEEARKKFSELQRTKKGIKLGPMSEEHKRKIGDAEKGKIVSEETREKIGNAHRGKQISEEQKKKLSKVNSGINNPMYGKRHTKEAKEKISKSNKGKPSPMKNKHHTDEAKKKISSSHKGIHAGEKNPMYGISPKERMDEETYNQWLIHQKENTLRGENHPMYGKAGILSPVFKPIYCIELNEIFLGGQDAGNKHQINSGNISSCCNGKVKSAGKHPITGSKLHWLYIEDQIQKDGSLIQGAITLGYITQDQFDNYLKNLKNTINNTKL